MATVTISPNMNLPIPTVSQDLGPDWANNINACLTGLDSHNHSAGQGVQITPSGLNINADLPLNGNNLTTARTVRFSAQGAPLALGSDVGCLYEVGVDLYYNDGAGNQVRITQSGSVTGSSGTITGLPSGTASASFSGGTFTFQAATNTPATINAGPYKFGQAVASGFGVTVLAAPSQAANYSIYWPAAAPTSADRALVSDASGNLSWVYAPIGQIPLGAVIGTFPNLSGAYSCTATTAADTRGFVKCNGQTISDVTSPMNGAVVPNINNTRFLAGSTTAGSTGGAATVTLATANLPGHTHGAGSFATSVGVTGGTASLTGTTTFGTTTHTHGFAHAHQWSIGSGKNLRGLPILDRSITAIGSGSPSDLIFDFQPPPPAGSATELGNSVSPSQSWYTTGPIDAPNGSGSSAVTTGPSATASVGISSTAASMTGSNTVTGTSGSAGSGTSFSILPSYITTLYVMRIK